MVMRGLSSPWGRRHTRHRYRRQRMPQEGMLIQVDGSYHNWLEERGPWFSLILSVDDATGKVPYAFFQKREDIAGYFRLMMGIIKQYGIPLALYSDRHVAFRHPRSPYEAVAGFLVDNGKPTQFGRAMRELGITHIFARSPEAKGRIERAAGTFQNRLVTELRLAGARTMDEANAVLETFLPRYNKRFAVRAALPEVAYRLVEPGLDIEGVLCIKERRRVARDNTVQYYGRTLQLFPSAERATYARTWVEVQQRLDGRIMVQHCGKVLTPEEAPPLADELRSLAAMKPEDRPGFMNLGVSSSIDKEPKAKKQPSGRGWNGDWYRDEVVKSMHRDLVLAGMEKARQQGKRIGRPRVTERPDFGGQFSSVIACIKPDGLSRRKAAKELGIGYATLKRLIDKHWQPNGHDVVKREPPVGDHCVQIGAVTDKIPEQ